MLRHFYCLLIRLHPSFFRERFEEEMLEIFDQESRPRTMTRLFVDAIQSLFRQWLLRPDFHRPMVAAAAQCGPSGVPLFAGLEDYKPRTATLIQGGLLSIAMFCGVVFAIGHSRVGQRIFIIGSHHPRAGLFSIDRSSYSEGETNTLVAIGDEPEDPWRPIALAYFNAIRVLHALDTNRDLAISAIEMTAAPYALRKLDLNENGNLSPEECGFYLGIETSKLTPEFVRSARFAFMRANPVLAVLDADKDGMISKVEIANSSATLRMLNRNRDGSLTQDEVLPEETTSQAVALFSFLVTNPDGRTLEVERNDGQDRDMKDLLKHADRDGDGVVTVEDLADELRLREERMRLDSAAKGVSSRRPRP